MILFKKSAKHNFKYIFVVYISFFTRNAIKKWNQECKKKQSLLFNFCNIFDLFSMMVSFKPDFYIFFYNEQLRKTKETSSTTFNVSHLLKVRSWISQFLKLDNIWTYYILKYLKIFNFRAPLNFTWIFIVLFIFTQLADLSIHTMINFAE